MDIRLKSRREYILAMALRDAFQGKVKVVMHEFKKGNLHSGKSKKVVKNRKQAIAIALSEARKKTGQA